MPSPKIAIIGGKSSYLLTYWKQLLQVNEIPCAVFELDKDRHNRSQGGSLDLHEGSAQVALREAGLFDQFMAVARPEGEVLKIYEPDGNLLLDESTGHGERRPDSFNGRPEVDRVQLRDMLIDSLSPGTIQWGRKLSAVKTTAEGLNPTYDLHFADGTTEAGFSLVVGADGTWSKVRPLLSDTRPQFSGINGVDVKLSNIDSVDAKLSERVGPGMCLTLGSNTTVLSQRNGDGCVRSYGFMRLPENWAQACGIDWSKPAEAKKQFLDLYYRAFDQDSRDLILKADDDSIVPRPMYMLPIGHKWPHRAGLTLIGDAAHVMTPFAGVGVNVAMEDALQLARSLVACKGVCAKTALNTHARHLSNAVWEYEEAMFIRAEAYAKETWMYLNLFFHERGGYPMCEHFANEKKQQQQQQTEVPEAQTAKVGS
ncbi:monooxygenase [Xylariaceae sp. AK1471]|nr:monooxygenase [Xylariaceae sp. AK1471]